MFFIVCTLHYTRRATEAAQNAVLLAKQTSATQLRAYVTLDRIDINHVQLYEKLTATSFVPVWKNSGATPARNVQYYTVLDHSRNTEPRNRTFPILNVTQNRTIIGPGIEELGPATRDVPEPEAQALVVGNFNHCIYGAVDYTDYTGAKRRTEFCVMVLLKQGGAGKHLLRFAKSAEHNGADEDCMREPYATTASPLRNPPSHSSETSKAATDP